MKKQQIKVMLVDDSRTIRTILKSSLQSDSQIKVDYEAVDGVDALARFKSAPADVIILDVEMPNMDGVETVKAIRKVNRKVPIIMFSTLTSRGGEATMDALTAGANDYEAKPSNNSHFEETKSRIKEVLVPKIKFWFGKNNALNAAPAAVKVVSPAAKSISLKTNPSIRSADRNFKIVAIGSSTGGPMALQTVLSDLPKTFSVPIVIVQHMPPVFTKSLAERLDSHSSLRVVEAEDGQCIRPQTVYIAPGGQHMTIERQSTDYVARMNSGPPINSCRPAVDVLFKSVAKQFGKNCLSVVLTGMGQDGLAGAKSIRDVDGSVIVQDEASSAVWGMPKVIADAGLAHEVLPLTEISSRVYALISKTNRKLEAVSI